MDVRTTYCSKVSGYDSHPRPFFLIALQNWRLSEVPMHLTKQFLFTENQRSTMPRLASVYVLFPCFLPLPLLLPEQQDK
jgi:hypothetical protein